MLLLVLSKWGSNLCVGVDNLYTSSKFILEKTLTPKNGFLVSNHKFYCISIVKKLVIISKTYYHYNSVAGLLMQRSHTSFWLSCLHASESLLVYTLILSLEMFFLKMFKTIEFWEIVYWYSPPPPSLFFFCWLNHL